MADPWGDIIHVASGFSLAAMLTLAVCLLWGHARVMGPLMVTKRRELGLWFLTGATTRATDMLGVDWLYMFARVANAIVGVLTAAMIVWALWRAAREA